MYESGAAGQGEAADLLSNEQHSPWRRNQLHVKLKEAVDGVTAALGEPGSGALAYREADLATRSNENCTAASVAGVTSRCIRQAGDRSPKPAETAVDADVIGRLLNGGGSSTHLSSTGHAQDYPLARWTLARAARAGKGRKTEMTWRTVREQGSVPVAFVLDHPEAASPFPRSRFIYPASAEPPPLFRHLAGRGCRCTPNACAGPAHPRLPPPFAAPPRHAPRGQRAGRELVRVLELRTARRDHRARASEGDGRRRGQQRVRRDHQPGLPAARISCLCIQQGWSPIVHNGFRNMSFSAMLTWGEGFAELLRPHNPAQRFVVTGSPVFDRRHDGCSGRQRLRAATGGSRP